MTNTDADARWCKAIEVGTENMTLEILGGPKNTQVLTLTMHAMDSGKSALDTTFGAQPDEKLTFMVPAEMLPLLVKNLLRAQQIFDGA